jgi:DNA-directed RNA polymerase II subunit RPB2
MKQPIDYNTDTWEVVKCFLKTNNGKVLIKHHIESFNDFMDHKIQMIVNQFNSVSIYNKYNQDTNNYTYEIVIDFGEIYFSNPIINENDGSSKTMYPNEARLRNLTYASTLSVDINIKLYKLNNDEKTILTTKTLNKVNIGNIPIMIGSKYCVLNNNTTKNNDECIYDFGGYFIINGNEKVVVCQEKIADNIVNVYKNSKNSSKYSHSVDIKSLSKDGFNTPKNFSIKLVNKDHKCKTLKISMPHCRLDIPLFVLFRAFGIISDKEILNYIVFDLNKNKLLLEWITPSIEDGNFITTQNDAIEYILKYGNILGQPKDIKISRERKIELFKDMIKRDVLSHVGEDLNKKALFLGYMVKKLFMCYTTQIEYDDRDSYCNKRVETSGYLMSILFRQYFTKMIKDMRNQIMKELNSTPWKYCNNDINIENIINENNLYKIFKSTTITSGMKYGLATGNWGIKSTNSKVGIAQVLSRLTYNSTLSHLRRINTPTEKTGKLIPPRKLHNTQWGIVCPAETPEGGSVGLVKNMAMSMYITNNTMIEPIVKIIENYNNVYNISNLDYSNLQYLYDKTKIFINGDWNYITTNTNNLMKTLIEYKRTGVIDIYTSITFNGQLNQINIFTDNGRCCRPLYIVENNKLLITKEHINKLKSGEYRFQNLIVESLNSYNSFIVNDHKTIKSGCIEYIDAEESYYKLIAVSSNDLNNSLKKYSHCEIHPCLILGVLASLIPFSNHNQSPRNTYQSAMGKQAMGIYMTNYQKRMDTMAHVLYYPNKPLVNTNIGSMLPSNNVPNGVNVIVAIASYSGYNQEDSIIINRGFVERGGFSSTFYRSYKDDEKKIQSSGQEEKFMKPDKNDTKGIKPGCYDKLNDNGFINVNSYVDSNDIIIGKVIPIKEKKGSYLYKDSSTFLRNNESGFIDDIYINRNGEGHKFCKIRVRSSRIPKIGDKFSSRHGQKGTCGMIINEEDMPYTKNGTRPDIIINPHAIPSRMTIAQLIECLLGKVCSLAGVYGDGTPFMGTSVENISGMLEQYDFEHNGNEILYNGFTGRQMESKIFIGPTYYQRLKHMVEDKIHSRSTGPMVLLTRQPAEGRARDGGLRFGEMERDCMIAHGSLQFLKERMIDVSDNYRVFVCNECGQFGAVNPSENIYKCKLCSNYSDFSEVRIPYSCKLLIQELQGMSISPRFITK